MIQVALKLKILLDDKYIGITSHIMTIRERFYIYKEFLYFVLF